jgi:hypothetical protein
MPMNELLLAALSCQTTPTRQQLRPRRIISEPCEDDAVAAVSIRAHTLRLPRCSSSSSSSCCRVTSVQGQQIDRDSETRGDVTATVLALANAGSGEELAQRLGAKRARVIIEQRPFR